MLKIYIFFLFCDSLLVLNLFIDQLIVIFFYMFIYNFSLIFFFWTLMQFISYKNLTINSLTDVKNNQFFLIVLTFIFFSIAGVPPFLGFFSKILILVLLLNSNFFFFFLFFIFLLFFALYFYLQNLRFLYSVTFTNINLFFFKNTQVSLYYTVFAFFAIILLLFSFLFFEDFFFFFFWILS